MTTDPLVTRAARHLALPQIGGEGQRRISSSTVLLIGVGGIGCAAATYLTTSGIGHLVLVDFDTVDATNLGRQTLYTPADIGRLKATCAAAKLRDLNPDIDVTPVTERLTGEALAHAVNSADAVLDGCDNFATRFAVNAACVANARHLVSTAAIRFEGQLAVFGDDYRVSPCYRCLYTEADETLDDCSGAGVFSPVPAIVGVLGAAECLKLAAGIGNRDIDSSCRLTLFDALSGEWRRVAVKKRIDCPTCGHGQSAG